MAYPTAYDRALARMHHVYPDAAKIKLEIIEAVLGDMEIEDEQIHWHIATLTDDEIRGLVSK